MNINNYKKVTDRIEPDEKCKEEVLNMNKRQQKIKQNIIEEVSGVDVRSGRSITRYIGIAAAFVLIAGSIGTTGVLLHNSNKNSVQLTDKNDETTSYVTEGISENTTADEIEATSVKTTEASNESSYESIAMKTIEDYFAAENLLTNGIISHDANDSIVFTTYDGFDDVWNTSFCGERKFYKVTDGRFKTCQDIYDYYKGFLTSVIKMTYEFESEEYEMPESYTDAKYLLRSVSDVNEWLGGDISKYESGSRVNVCPESYDVWDETAKTVNYATYVEYKGDLYVAELRHEVDPLELNPVFTFGPKIADITENSFSATVFRKNENYDNIKYGIKETYNFVLEDGKWKIYNLTLGEDPEMDSSGALIRYLCNHEEYSDICQDYPDIEPFIEIVEYDIDARICKIHGVLHNMDGEDAIDVTADIDLNNPTVTSADIKRIK